LNRLKSRDKTKFKEAGWTRDGIQSQPLKPTSMLFGPHAVQKNEIGALCREDSVADLNMLH